MKNQQHSGFTPSGNTPNKTIIQPRTTPTLKNTPSSEENKNMMLKNYFQSPSAYKSISSDSNRIEKSTLGDDELGDLKTKLIYQTNTIKEYDIWVGQILNIINSKIDSTNHYDYGTSIQKGLEKIENLENENFELKKKHLREINKNKEKFTTLEELQCQIDIISSDFKDGNGPKLLDEKNHLLENDLSEKNKNYTKIVNSSTELKRIQNLYNELRNLKEENKELKEIENYQNLLKSKNKKIEFNYLQTERIDKPMSSLTVQTVRYNNTLRNSHESHSYRYSKSTERKTNNKK